MPLWVLQFIYRIFALITNTVPVRGKSIVVYFQLHLCAFRVFASKRHQNAAIKWNVIDYMDNASQRHINHYKIYLAQFDSSESWLKSSISNLLMEPESDFEWIPFIYTSCDTYMGREHDNIWINDRFSTNTRDDHTRHLFIQHKHKERYYHISYTVPFRWDAFHMIDI